MAMQLVKNESGSPMTDSKMVSDVFGKIHRNVMRDIKGLIDKAPEFGALNFEQSSYKSKQNKDLPCYLMTKDGFTLLAMGYGTEKAIKFKISYINQFNEMDLLIKNSVSLSQEIDGAMISFNEDKGTASYCGKGLSLWKGKRDKHIAKIESLVKKQQMCLDLF